MWFILSHQSEFKHQAKIVKLFIKILSMYFHNILDFRVGNVCLSIMRVIALIYQMSNRANYRISSQRSKFGHQFARHNSGEMQGSPLGLSSWLRHSREQGDEERHRSGLWLLRCGFAFSMYLYTTRIRALCVVQR